MYGRLAGGLAIRLLTWALKDLPRRYAFLHSPGKGSASDARLCAACMVTPAKNLLMPAAAALLACARHRAPHLMPASALHAWEADRRTRHSSAETARESAAGMLHAPARLCRQKDKAPTLKQAMQIKKGTHDAERRVNKDACAKGGGEPASAH
jgi:hypothetical protein